MDFPSSSELYWNPWSSTDEDIPTEQPHHVLVDPAVEKNLGSVDTTNVTDMTDVEVVPNDVSRPANTRNKIEDHTTKCFRIQGIPESWTKDKLLEYLVYKDLDLEKFEVSLYPSCSCPGIVQTAVLSLEGSPKFIQPVLENGEEAIFVDVPEHISGEKGVQLEIDRHFYGLTPLNSPEGEEIVDIIAVTGLAGHAFGSWKSRKTQKMWLQDFLPQEPGLRRARIMTYGYNTKLTEGKVNDGMIDYRRQFIQQLNNARDSAEKKSRPIIFIGHSLGGILIAQALVHSKNMDHSRHILDSTHAVIFFGTPHKGLKVSQLESMIIDIEKNSDSTRLHLLSQLKESSQSQWLEEQRDHLADVWAKIGVVSFYETETTPTVAKSESGVYGRFGEEVEMVTRVSAEIGFPNEHRIPIGRSHTEMVKFPSKIDPSYRSVVSHIVHFLKEAAAITDRKKSIKKFHVGIRAIREWLRTCLKTPIDIRRNSLGRDRKAEREFLKNLAVNLILKR